MKEKSLFVVEDEDGEMLDTSGNGGFTVFTSFAEAQDALDSEAGNSEESRDLYKQIVEYYRKVK